MSARDIIVGLFQYLHNGANKVGIKADRRQWELERFTGAWNYDEE